MSELLVGGRPVRLDPARAIGKGGEADVYDLGNGLALKVFKGPDHPDYRGLPGEARAAAARIALQQRKLRAFPLPLPARVIQPQELAVDRKGRVAGYTMQLVGKAVPLARYADRGFRQHVAVGKVLATFRDLHRTVAACHGAGVVIGDCNDLNVLVRDDQAYLIDVDSYQFGAFPCPVFSARFVDPLLCGSAGGMLTLVDRYGPDSDWYAFAVMLMQSLLFVDPYGGLYQAPGQGPQVAHCLRPLQRITVFHPAVRYPKPAVPLRALGDELFEHLRAVFVDDLRGPFPLSLLEAGAWHSCSSCGLEHAARSCPGCRHPVTVQPLVRHGLVRETEVFRTGGVLLHAAWQDGALRWLWHESGTFRREDGTVVAGGPLQPGMRCRIAGRASLIGFEDRFTTYRPGQAAEPLVADSYDRTPMFEANGRGRWWLYGGRLLRDGPFGPEAIGEVLAGQTRFWVGEEFGLGFYRAGALTVAFVFDAIGRGLNDSVALPSLPGHLLDAGCCLAAERAWLLLATREGGRTVHRCVLVRSSGAVEAVGEAEAGDGSWLGSWPGGACAAGEFLLVPTDGGIVRVEALGGRLQQTRAFPDTEPFVDRDCALLAGAGGIYVLERQRIRLLRLG